MWKKEKKAFKEGKRIQWKRMGCNWDDIQDPSFIKYRIHPEDIELITEWHDKLVVHCKTKEQMGKVIELQPKAKSILNEWDIHKYKTCIRNNGIYSHKGFYKDEGYEVIKAKEFLKRYKPKKKEIGKEPLKEGEWCAFWMKGFTKYIVSTYVRFEENQHYYTSVVGWDCALPISVGHEVIVKAMEETKDA